MRVPISSERGYFGAICLWKIFLTDKPARGVLFKPISPRYGIFFRKLPKKLGKGGGGGFVIYMYNIVHIYVSRAFNSLPRNGGRAHIIVYLR